MKASLDTNVIIHFYRAGLQNDLFELFSDGVLIYEQIRKIELVNHGKDILDSVDRDISLGKITLFSDEDLRSISVYNLFQRRVQENRILYQPRDLGEVYAISLAQTLGAYSLVTDDIKQGGPYMSLLQMDDYDLLPFSFADVLFLRFMFGLDDAELTIEKFSNINDASGMNWSFGSHLKRFINLFWMNPYKSEEKQWMRDAAEKYGFSPKSRLKQLNSAYKKRINGHHN